MKHLFLSLALLAAVGCTADNKKEITDSSAPSKAAHEDPDGFYTCPMHPEIHTHEPGNCPICGMALVKVSGSQEKKTESTGPALQPTDFQLANAGIGRLTVERKDIEISIPVSGRLVGPRSVVFQVYEKDLATLRVGASFGGSASTSPGDRIEGKINRIDNLVDPSSRTLRVTGSLNSAPSPFALEGMFLATIKVLLKKQIAIPEDAVLHTGRKDIVYAIGEENRLTPVQVALGAKAGEQYQILSGLKEGDVISGGPNFLIDSESKIRMVPTPQGEGKGSSDAPACPEGQHWDVPMNMCMPGEGQ